MLAMYWKNPKALWNFVVFRKIFGAPQTLDSRASGIAIWTDLSNTKFAGSKTIFEMVAVSDNKSTNIIKLGVKMDFDRVSSSSLPDIYEGLYYSPNEKILYVSGKCLSECITALCSAAKFHNGSMQWKDARDYFNDNVDAHGATGSLENVKYIKAQYNSLLSNIGVDHLETFVLPDLQNSYVNPSIQVELDKLYARKKK